MRAQQIATRLVYTITHVFDVLYDDGRDGPGFRMAAASAGFGLLLRSLVRCSGSAAARRAGEDVFFIGTYVV